MVTSANRIRRNIKDFSKEDKLSLRTAFKRMSDDGRYEEIASFHGLPAQCPNADGSLIHTCCLHGMPTFPHWHRLYLSLVENELLARGSDVAVPYWDWIEPFDSIPALLSDETYKHPKTNEDIENPFHHGKISFEETITVRKPRNELFNNRYLYEHALYAFEHTDFCEFEVHYEVLHNAIHSWIGGPDPHSMSSLDYAAYDPIFFFHHSTLDRLWAIWQELQRYRKMDYNVANCALRLLSDPMRPFNNKTANQDHLTFTNSRPNDVFDYQNSLNYKFDTLSFSGLSIPQLDDLLESRRSNDRTFAGFWLHGIKASADIYLYICVPIGVEHENCDHLAGTFSVLGGDTEMPWKFDRLFRYEITEALKKLQLTEDSKFRLKTEIIALNGTKVRSDIFPAPSIVFIPKKGE